MASHDMDRCPADELGACSLNRRGGCTEGMSEPEFDKGAFRTGKADDSVHARVCRAHGQPADCDVCLVASWYGDGECDTFCERPDPDCGLSPSELDAGVIDDGGPSSEACGSTAELCTTRGAECDPLVVTDTCGESRRIECGTCAAPEVCGPNGLAGRRGVERVFAASETGGAPVSLALSLMDHDIAALEAVSPTEAWVGGGSELVRVREESAGGVELFRLDPTLGSVRGFWSSSPGDVWVRASNGVAHFDGTSWAAVDPGLSSEAEVVALHGTASDDLWVATASEIRHFDGREWAAWPVPRVGRIRDIGGIERGRPYVVSGSRIYRYNGLSYVELSDPPRTSSRFWISPTGTLFVLTERSDGGFYSSQGVYRRDGETWTELFGEYRAHRGCTVPASEVDIDGYSDSEVVFGTCWGRSYRYDGENDPEPQSTDGHRVAATGVNAGFVASGRALTTRVGADWIPRFHRGNPPECRDAYPSGIETAWRLCNGGRLAEVKDGFLFEGTDGLAAIFTAPGTSLWLAYDDGTLEQRRPDGEVIRYAEFAGSTFRSLSATADDDVWALTDGDVAHFDGSAWRTTRLPTSMRPSQGRISASGNQVWVWYQLQLFRWSGTEWLEVALPTGRTRVTGLEASRSGAWLLGEDRDDGRSKTLYRWDGASWVTEATFAGGRPYLGRASGAIVTGHREDAGYLLETWTDGGSTRVTTLADDAVGWPLLLGADDLLLVGSSNLYQLRLH